MKWHEDMRTEFESEGIIKVCRLVETTKTQRTVQAIDDELTRLKWKVNGKWHTKKFEDVPLFQVTNLISQKLSAKIDIEGLIPKDVVSSLSELVGVPIPQKASSVQALITPPQKGVWSVPKSGWHVDIKNFPRSELPGVQIFVILCDLPPHGGGTLALKRSHLHDSKEVNQDLIVELHGKAGDVYFMDMRLLHAPSLNASHKARMMATARYIRGDALS